VYRQARNVYRRLLKPELYAIDCRDRERLRRFVPKGSLVFDVGANIGDVTSLLLDIGARVVSIEPNPRLADVVLKRHGVTVESVALGAWEGETTLHLGRDPGHSTLSEKWRHLHPERFAEAISVRVTTLDAMIARHGIPRFVKIDVEGYEPSVLQGLSRPLEALSFEFQRALPDATEQCVARLMRLETYRFQFVQNSSLGASELTPDQPVDFEEVLDLLARLPVDSYGDLYAMRQRPPIYSEPPI
jgi:FkbM family methyltransferase